MDAGVVKNDLREREEEIQVHQWCHIGGIESLKVVCVDFTRSTASQNLKVKNHMVNTYTQGILEPQKEGLC